MQTPQPPLPSQVNPEETPDLDVTFDPQEFKETPSTKDSSSNDTDRSEVAVYQKSLAAHKLERRICIILVAGLLLLLGFLAFTLTQVSIELANLVIETKLELKELEEQSKMPKVLEEEPIVVREAEPPEVCKLVFIAKDGIQADWRVMTKAEAKANFYECTRDLPQWAIITLFDGRIVGRGYSYDIEDQTDLSCGDKLWTFIMENYDNADPDLDAC